VRFNAHFDRRLLDAAHALDNRGQPIAETWRQVGLVAAKLGAARPGYDEVRRVVLAERRRKEEVLALLREAREQAVRGRFDPWELGARTEELPERR
jgi:hypothetical protein